MVEAADKGQSVDQTAVLACLGRLDLDDDARAAKLALVVYRTLKCLSLHSARVRDAEIESPCVAALARDPVNVGAGERSRGLERSPRAELIRSVAVFLQRLVELSIVVRLLGRRRLRWRRRGHARRRTSRDSHPALS